MPSVEVVRAADGVGLGEKRVARDPFDLKNRCGLNRRPSVVRKEATAGSMEMASATYGPTRLPSQVKP